MNDRILKLRDVIDCTKMSRSLIYKAMKEGSFPRNFRLGRSRCVGWLQSEVLFWVSCQSEHNRRDLEVAVV